MIKQLFSNYWFRCAWEAFYTFCFYFGIICLSLTLIRLTINALSN
jgi:hypothetical protein